MAVDYEVYLNSPHWHACKRAAIERAGHKCQVCGADRVRMDVHHNSYQRMGREDITDLVVLCETCHAVFHLFCRLPVHGEDARHVGKALPGVLSEMLLAYLMREAS